MKTKKRSSLSWFERLQASLKGWPRIHHLNEVTVGDIWGAKDHTTGTHELIHVLEGRAKIHWGTSSVAVKPGDTFLVPMGLPHRDVRESPPPYRAFYVYFHWPSGEALLRGLPLQRIIRAPEAMKLHWRMLVKEMENTYSGGAQDADQQLQIQLLELLLAMIRHTLVERPQPDASGARQRRAQLAAEARDYLETHFASSFTLDALADHLEVSPFHLCRVYSKQFGHSITDALTHIRIDQAKEFLRNPKASVKEVAALAGFSNANYFAKVFRRLTGVSPSAFQAQARQYKQT